MQQCDNADGGGSRATSLINKEQSQKERKREKSGERERCVTLVLLSLQTNISFGTELCLGTSERSMPYLQFLIALLISGHEINKAGNNQGPTIDSLVSLTSGIKYPNSALGNLTVAYEKDETGRFKRGKKAPDANYSVFQEGKA